MKAAPDGRQGPLHTDFVPSPDTHCAPRPCLLGWGGRGEIGVTDEQLALAAIERADEPWLSAAAIASAAGLSVERVRAALDPSAAVIVESAPAGQPRYSTREHYRATTGLLRRYVDALLSS